MSETAQSGPTDDELLWGDVDAEDTPLGSTILDRPEVRDVTIHTGGQCVIVLVTFETWSIPSDFGAQYGMQLVSASIVDKRDRWKRMLDAGRNAWLEARYVKEDPRSWEAHE